MKNLEALEKEILQDPVILGFAYIGSLARGDYTPYSDVDMAIVVEPKVLEDENERVLRWLGKIGDVKFYYSPYDHYYLAYVGSDYTCIDISVYTVNSLRPALWLHPGRVLKDSDGCLSDAISQSAQLSPAPTSKEMLLAKAEMYDGQIWLPRQMLRGRYWIGGAEIRQRAQRYALLLLRMKGVDAHDLRFVERHMDREEVELLQAAYPLSNTIKDTIEATRSLRALARYVEDFYEKSTGRELPQIAADENGVYELSDRLLNELPLERSHE